MKTEINSYFSSNMEFPL